jgi:hypothetical protein
MIAYLHTCRTFAEFGQCRCFDDVVMMVGWDGHWWYWHRGVFTEGQGMATAEMVGRPVVNGEIGKTAEEIARSLGVVGGEETP